MESIRTQYGTINGVKGIRYDREGQIQEVEVTAYSPLETAYGEFIPMYQTEQQLYDRTKKERPSVCFFSNNRIKSIALEEQTTVKTSIGDFDAELVTFYEDGSLKRVFPLNGHINGYWTEEDEATLAKVYSFQMPIGHFSAKIIGVHFYPTGKVRSVTLWPGEVIEIMTPQGKMHVRHGFSLYENGELESLEPAIETFVRSPIGIISCFDKDALGIHADQNSLVFNEDGTLQSLITSQNGVLVENDYGNTFRIEPQEVPSYIEETEVVTVPLKITFEQDKVRLDNGKDHWFPIKDHEFKVYNPANIVIRACTDCSSCSGCH